MSSSTQRTTAREHFAPALAAAPRSATRPDAAGGRMPGLDGLRAIAVALVILWHVAMNRPTLVRGLDHLWQLDVGNLGVRVFFVLSGFLITTLLLAEQRDAGRVDLRRFYVRRTLRIFPAYYAFLAVMAIGAALGAVHANGAALLHAATYTSNYLSIQWPVGHSWSLAVEEQFYLLWPGLLVLLGTRRAFIGAAAMLVVSPIFRVLAAHEPSLWPTYWRFAFECVADALATGCLLAYLRPRLWSNGAYRALLSSRWMFVVPTAVLALSIAGVVSHTFSALIGVTLMNLGIAAIIDWSLRFPSGAVGRMLNWRPLAFVGTLSYSLYLWQQPFLSKVDGPALPIAFAGIACAALASFYLIERPMLRLRSRLEHEDAPVAAQDVQLAGRVHTERQHGA